MRSTAWLVLSPLLLLALPLLALGGDTPNDTSCTPQTLISPGMGIVWYHQAGAEFDVPPVPQPIMRGPNQLAQDGYSTAYGIRCPTSGAMNFPYWTENPTSPGAGGVFVFNKTLIIPSSNTTLAPFSNPLLPVEDLLVGPLAKPTTSTCDAKGRCIDAYDLVATIEEFDLGFKDANGKPLLSQLLVYNKSFPAPHIVVTQGVQTLIRLHNHIHCNTTTNTPSNSSCSYYDMVKDLTFHHHGGSTLSPFDGWAPDHIPACGWKDYVYPNQNGMACNWYHDHQIGYTSITAGSGLVGTIFVKPCDLRRIPAQLLALSPTATPQYLMFNDMIFYQVPGSQFMNPYMFNTFSVQNTPTSPFNMSDAASADHVFVNGKPWPQVSVQRKPYWFILHNAAQTRTFNLILQHARTNATHPVWFVGSEGGLRTSPYMLNGTFLMGTAERYQVVIDFSDAKPGDEFIFQNPPTTEANFAQFCYTNYVIKFVVDGSQPPSAPFDSNYSIPLWGDGDNLAEEVQQACAAATARGADMQMVAVTKLLAPLGNPSDLGAQWAVTSVNFSSTAPVPNQWAVAFMDPSNYTLYSGWGGMRRSRSRRAAASRRSMLRPAPGAVHTAVEVLAFDARETAVRRGLLAADAAPDLHFLADVLPLSAPQNGWATWSVSNAGVGTHPHPIHLHLLDFYICGHSANFSRPYEQNTPKDTVFVDSSDVVTVAARWGPHQGEFQFHCHNLYHEDGGLMGQFNVTSFTKPAITTTFFNSTTKSKDQYGMGKGAYDKYAVHYPYSDPLYRSVPDYPHIGHDLYFPDAMPPWAVRTDPKHPGRPLPLTKSLLLKVLNRNYYAVYYPKTRNSLSEPVPDNKWAVVCPAKTVE